MISATELPVSTPREPVAEAISLKQDTARQKLAGWIMLLLAGEIVCLAAAVLIPTLLGREPPMSAVKNLAVIVLTPTVALADSAIGFYFGSPRDR